VEKQTFEMILNDIGADLAGNNVQGGRPRIAPQKQLQIALWVLANNSQVYRYEMPYAREWN
jgi:hypothetical protein